LRAVPRRKLLLALGLRKLPVPAAALQRDNVGPPWVERKGEGRHLLFIIIGHRGEQSIDSFGEAFLLLTKTSF